MDKETESSFELIGRYTIANKQLIHFGIIIGLLAIAYFSASHQIQIIENNDTITYKNATSIIGSGFSVNSGNNTSLISSMGDAYWVGNESSGIPFSIYINFTNVTHFDYVESIHKYNSSSGTPSTHIISRYIWCVTMNDWTELEEFSNEDNWYYFVKPIIDSQHFIQSNGNVSIKYSHPSSGNNAHRIFIDKSVLVTKR